MKKLFRALTLIAVLFSANVYSATYTVTIAGGNNPWGWPNPGSAGSFVEALWLANTNPGPDIIEFNIAGVNNVTSTSGAVGSMPASIVMNDVTINGINQATGSSIVFSFTFEVSGSDNTINDLSFLTTNHSLNLTGSRNTINNCNFTTTGVQQNSIWANGGGNGNLIKACVFTNTVGHAVSLDQAGGNNTVDSCVVTGNTDVGIIAWNGSNTIKRCLVSDGAHNGIGLVSGDNLVDSCTSFNNARAGIAVDDVAGPGVTASSNRITNNIIYGNNNNFWMSGGNPTPEQGAIYSDGANTTIQNNYIYDNAANGIIVYEQTLGANGSTISNNIIGRNPLGAELGNGWNGVFVWRANDVTTDNNIIVNNGSGTSHNTYTMYDRISGVRYQDVTSGTISTNYIGTDAAKTSAGNDFDGITLHTNVSNLNVSGNTIGYNGLNSIYGIDGGGIAVRVSSNNNTFQSNNIGMHADLTDAGNNDYGISIEGSFGNQIGGATANLGNNIGYSKNTGNQGCGVWIAPDAVGSTSSSNEFYNNNISFNTGDGVLIEKGSVSNIVGSLTAGNTINNNRSGIRIQENGTSPANLNSLRGNSFSCNTEEGITLEDNGNNLYGGIGSSKIVTTNASETRPTFVSGTAPANAAVDIYTHDLICAPTNCEDTISQGTAYITTVTADGSGAWEFDFSTIPGTSLNQSNVVVMATDTAAGPGSQNSSEFSICAITCTAPQNAAITGENVCIGATGTLTATANNINPTGTYQYYWYLGSVALANEVTPRNAINDNNITTTVAGDYIVVIAETKDSAACRDQSSSHPFTVNSLPVVSVANVASICADETATFTASSDSTADSYLWSDQGSGTAVTTTGSTAGDYTVTVTDVNGCQGTGTGSLIVNPLPTINFTAPNPAFCEGGSAQVDAGTAPGMTLLWTTGESTNQITVTAGGDYGIKVTDPVTGCDDSLGVNVTEHPLPTVTLGNGQICKGDSYTFDAGNPGSNYSWLPNGETTQTITASVQGTYTVTVTDPITTCSNQASGFADENPDETPSVMLGEDDSLCYLKGETVEITALVVGGLGGTLEWSNGTFGDSAVVFSDTLTIWAMYTDTFNCVGADTLKIHNYCEPPVVDVPNVFIPGGTDNPVFTPIGNLTPEDVLDGHMEIYDRWGLKMFETDEKVPTWDGTYNGRVVSSGVYFWIWIYRDVTETDYKLNGFVEVLKK